MMAMRKLLTSVFFLISLFGCEENERKLDSISYIETIPGGCAIDNTKSIENITKLQNDTVTYIISDNNLEIFIGFNATCCGEYNTSSTIQNDTIFINIDVSQIGMCDCICYYTYTFKYTGINKEHNYLVNIDNYLTFAGLIEF